MNIETLIQANKLHRDIKVNEVRLERGISVILDRVHDDDIGHPDFEPILAEATTKIRAIVKARLAQAQAELEAL